MRRLEGHRGPVLGVDWSVEHNLLFHPHVFSRRLKSGVLSVSIRFLSRRIFKGVVWGDVMR